MCDGAALGASRMGCSAEQTAVARVRVRDHEAISLLMALDDHLYEALRSGAPSS